MIAGLEPISGGSVAIDGRVVNDVPARDRDIAMVFQSYAALSAHERVRQPRLWPAAAAASPGPRSTGGCAARRRSSGLRRSSSASHTPSPAASASASRSARIVREPKVFLFDEPAVEPRRRASASPRARAHRQQHEIGITTIYVTMTRSRR